MIKQIRKLIRDNQKVDCFSINIIINKNNRDVANMIREINTSTNEYPNARNIKKLFENDIKKTILDNKFYNAKVSVCFNCKIGTYKRKQLVKDK